MVDLDLTRLMPPTRASDAEVDVHSTAFAQDVLRSVAAQWDRVVPRDAFDNTNLDPTVIAARMLAAVPRENPFNDSIGPFYDTAGLTRWLGVQKQRLNTLRNQRRLLAIKTSRNRVVYPSFQFGASGELLPGLQQVMTVLEPVMNNPLSVARWLNTPAERFQSRSAAEALRDNDIDEVVEAARQVAEAMSH